MRVVFMGTPAFAVPSLRLLDRDHDVVGVYTRPDAASGRGSTLRPSPVKETALELGLRVLQPTTLRDVQQQATLAAIAPDLIVVAAYGLILPVEVLEVPRLGCVNVHASLLPRWRGAAPIQRAVLAGDAETGVSIMRMEEGLDTGPFCETISTEVGSKTANDLTAELAQLGADALARSLPRIAAGTCEWIEQDEASVTYAEKIRKDDVTIAPDLPVVEALRRVRASTPQAPARIEVAGRGATVLSADVHELQLAPGAIACLKRALLIGLSDGTLCLGRVKPDGKSEMDGCDWARGARIGPEATWEAGR